MNDVHLRNVGYAFCLAPSIQTRDSYDAILRYMYANEYSTGDRTSFIVTSSCSKEILPMEDYHEIDRSFVDTGDIAIRNIMLYMGLKSVLVLSGTTESDVDILESFCIYVAKVMNGGFCTIFAPMTEIVDMIKYRLRPITDHVNDVSGWSRTYEAKNILPWNDSNTCVWCLDGNGDYPVGVGPDDAAIMKAIQYNRGSPISTLRRLSSYLISCLPWEEIMAAGVSSEDQYEKGGLSLCRRCSATATWDFTGYILISTKDLSSIHMGDIRGSHTAARVNSILLKHR